ncbi:amidohydrolase family protein, partial [Ornithinibacter sp.]|uniref:amidohydrolase family protein n=1 Tax=Ornithinibacter sp. TaxID=2862748 RepID=UPI002D04D8D5
MSTTLYRGGTVHTPDQPRATALVVGDDGRIAWIGDEEGAARHRDGVDTVVDLDGGLVLPAFVDAHVHLSHTGMGLRGVDLGATTSVAQALRRIEEAARRHGGRPIFAFGWQEQ